MLRLELYVKNDNIDNFESNVQTLESHLDDLDQYVRRQLICLNRVCLDCEYVLLDILNAVLPEGEKISSTEIESSCW